MDNFSGYYDYELRILGKGQKIGIATTATLLLAAALIFNVSAFSAHMKRKMRPFFRACLISLTISDTITVVFMYTNYISQMTNDLSGVWSLGDILCGFIPFAQTTAILVNSFTLVSIALDRYLAIVKFVKGTWNPSKLFCTASTIMIWGIAAALASPLLTVYHTAPIQVMETLPNDPTVFVSVRQATMCICIKNFVKYFYTVAFVVIFLPILTSFLWLYLIIAKEIWYRRRPIQPSNTIRLTASTTSKCTGCSDMTGQAKCNNNGHIGLSSKRETNDVTPSSSTTAVLSTSIRICPNPGDGMSTPPPPHQIPPPAPPPPPPKATKSRREVRQVRMFSAILILMATFLICRLPTWSFLVYKSNFPTITNLEWMLNFCFGLLSMTNCVMNPILYTFLTETIEISLTFFNRFGQHIRMCCGRE